MIALSPSASRLIPAPHVSAIYSQLAARKAQRAEVQRVIEHPSLRFFQPESEALGEVIDRIIAEDERRVTNYERTAKPLEEAVAVEAQARVACQAAIDATNIGSVNREASLKMRDDLYHTNEVVGIRRRELAAAVENTKAFTLVAPNVGAVVPMVRFEEPNEMLSTTTRTVNVAEFLAVDSIHRKHRKDLVYPTINASFWQAALDLDEGIFRWLPLAASKVLADEDLWHHELQYESGRFRSAKDCRPLFIAALERLKTERASALRSKVSQAASQLEAAKGAAASAGVAA
jgi:hypothetical protein